LLTANRKKLKLTDFGLAREETVTEMMTAETGTYRWMAPEVVNTIFCINLKLVQLHTETKAAFGWLAGCGWAGQRSHSRTVLVNSVFSQNSIFPSQQSAGTVFCLIFQSCRTGPKTTEKFAPVVMC